MQSVSLIDVDALIESFIKDNATSINSLHKIYYQNDNPVSLQALKEGVKEDLRTGCVSFINKGSPIEELNNYLFYIVNAFCKKAGKPDNKQKIEYICPGCVFLGKEYSVLVLDKIFQCDECSSELKKSINDPKKNYFFQTFYQHNKSGYRCPDCERFIPHPLNNYATIACPYFDCIFTGELSSLQKMHHPTSKSNPEKLILDASQENGFVLKNNLASQDANADTQLEINEELQNKVKTLKDIIETQSNNTAYSSSDVTLKHKQLVYQAINNLLEEFPVEMSEYLLGNSDSHMGFQHKIFQEYIKLLEESFPFFISKNKKLIKIDNLLDNNLCLFDGISVFEGIVNEKLFIKNETKEFYIGGRKAAYAKPYYIGKLLNVIENNTKIPLIQQVKDYSFSKIRMQNVKPGISVTVTHLRIPPHYQMGGMVYVNRIRKKIVERAKYLIQ